MKKEPSGGENAKGKVSTRINRAQGCCVPVYPYHVKRQGGGSGGVTASAKAVIQRGSCAVKTGGVGGGRRLGRKFVSATWAFKLGVKGGGAGKPGIRGEGGNESGTAGQMVCAL